MSDPKPPAQTFSEKIALNQAQRNPDSESTTTGGRKYNRRRNIRMPKQSRAFGPVSGMEHYTMSQAGTPVYHAPKSKYFQGKPPQKNPSTILQDKIRIMKQFHSPITFNAPVGVERNRLQLQAKREGEHRKTSPVWQAERALWDAQMQKLGLTPEGQRIGRVRAMMIQNMNRLRGGM